MKKSTKRKALVITAFTDRRRDDSRYVSAGVYCLPQTALECLAQCRAAGITRMRSEERRVGKECGS